MKSIRKIHRAARCGSSAPAPRRGRFLHIILGQAALLLATSFLAGAKPPPASANRPATLLPPNHVPGSILLQPKAGVPEELLQALVAGHGARQVDAIHQINVRLLHVPDTALPTALAALQHNANIQFAEPDCIVEPALTPNDTYYSLEWHLPKIQAPEAWDITTGSASVVIAILDSGIDATHPDLAGVILPGWNFCDGNADTSDVTGHGTGVAGTAAGCGNNGLGVAPIAWACKILPVRISDTNGYASLSTIAKGLTWAADQGARVANISYRASSGSTITTAAQYFQIKGGVVSVSAGNTGTFDSSADNPYLLTVSATDENDVIASWSTTGNNVDLSAPGVNILTTTAGGSYGSGSGTSFAAPVVAGVAALVLSANPTLTGAQVQDILKQTADDLGAPGWDTTYGSGRVNALRAVQAAINVGSSDTLPPSVAISSPVSGATLSGIVTVQVNATDNVGVARVELYLDGSLAGRSDSSSASFSWDTTADSNGAHTLHAKAYDAAGNVGVSASDTVTVQNTLPDTTAPSVTILAPVSGSTVAGTTAVNISATDNVGVTTLELYVDGALAGTAPATSATFSWDTKTAANGAHTLQAKACDAAGNIGTSTTVTVMVQNPVPDTTPPTVAITKPTAGTVVGKSTSVSVVASDDAGVTRVVLLVDGKKYSTSSSPTPTFTWNTSKLSRGPHTLQSVAYDAAGNSARSAVVTVMK